MQSILAVIMPTSTFWPTMTEEHRWWMVVARHTMVTPCDNYCDDFCHNSCDNWDRQDGQLQVASDPCVTIPHWQICILSGSRLDETLPVLLFLCPGNDCRVCWLQHCFIRCNGRKNKTGALGSVKFKVRCWKMTRTSLRSLRVWSISSNPILAIGVWSGMVTRLS